MRSFKHLVKINYWRLIEIVSLFLPYSWAIPRPSRDRHVLELTWKRVKTLFWKFKDDYVHGQKTHQPLGRWHHQWVPINLLIIMDILVSNQRVSNLVTDCIPIFWASWRIWARWREYVGLIWYKEKDRNIMTQQIIYSLVI